MRYGRWHTDSASSILYLNRDQNLFSILIGKEIYLLNFLVIKQKSLLIELEVTEDRACYSVCHLPKWFITFRLSDMINQSVLKIYCCAAVCGWHTESRTRPFATPISIKTLILCDNKRNLLNEILYQLNQKRGFDRARDKGLSLLCQCVICHTEGTYKHHPRVF